MIHLVLRQPNEYQRILCQTLHGHFAGRVAAWFAEPQPPHGECAGPVDFEQHYLEEEGYRQLFQRLRQDKDAVLILGGWSSTIAFKTLAIAKYSRTPVIIWADHPRPQQRSRTREHLRSAYLRRLGRHALAFLACGKPTAEHLVSLGLPREKIFNFPYWVDLPASWSPPSRCIEQGGASVPLRLVAVGRLVPVKRFDVAIRAVAGVNNGAKQTVAELLIIGDGPERDSLTALAQSLNCQSVVQLPGWQSNEEVQRQMRAADAVIVPSGFEPYGVVVLEAMAECRPVLASDQVIAALDRDDQTGAILLHPTGDDETLARQITALANDPDRLMVASRAARAMAEKWPPQRAAEIIEGILEGRRSITESQTVEPEFQQRRSTSVNA